jgi:hypothetical protein
MERQSAPQKRRFCVKLRDDFIESIGQYRRPSFLFREPSETLTFLKRNFIDVQIGGLPKGVLYPVAEIFHREELKPLEVKAHLFFHLSNNALGRGFSLFHVTSGHIPGVGIGDVGEIVAQEQKDLPLFVYKEDAAAVPLCEGPQECSPGLFLCEIPGDILAFFD